MYKQSIGLVTLQLFSIFLGVFSFLYVAKNVNPNIFSIVAVSSMITTIVTIFSTTGLEQYNIRNLLKWRLTENISRIKILIELSLKSRIYLSIILNICLTPLYIFLSVYKYNSEHLVLFISVGLLSVFSSVADSIFQIYKSLNRTLDYQFVSVAFLSIFRILSILAFINYSIYHYIIIGLFANLFITFYFLIKLKNELSIGLNFNLKIKKSILLLNKSNINIFRKATYISYLYRSSDQLLISLLAPVNVIGSYGFCKNILDLINVLLQNIFEPLIQRFIEFKNDSKAYINYFNKVLYTRNILMILMILISPVFYFTNDLLIFFKINHYPNLFYYFIFIYTAQFFYLNNVLDIGKITLFESEKFYFRIILIQSISMLLFLLLFINISDKLLFLNFTLSNICVYLFIYLKKKNKAFIDVAD